MEKTRERIKAFEGSNHSFWGRIGKFFLATKHAKIVMDLTQEFNEQLKQILFRVQLRTHEGVKDLQDRDILRKLDSSEVKTARYDCFSGRTGCVPGTRTQVIDDIRQWISSPCQPRVYWLYGNEGSGKTTVAYTIAKEYDSQRPDHPERLSGILSACFFCTIGDKCELENSSSAILRTLSSQLKHNQTFEGSLIRILKENENNSSILYGSTDLVSEYLLLRPFKDLEESRDSGLEKPPIDTVLLILDGIDEAADQHNTSSLLKALIRLTESLPRLKILISSRRVPHIAEILDPSSCASSSSSTAKKSTPKLCVIYDLDTRVPPSILNRDMMTFLLSPEGGIPEQLRTDNNLIRLIIQQANGCFIYASTLCERLARPDAKDFAQRFIKKAQAGSSRLSKLGDLDSLYTDIVRGAIEKITTPSTRRKKKANLRNITSAVGTETDVQTEGIKLYLLLVWIVGALPLQQPLSLVDVVYLLCIDRQDAKRLFGELSSHIQFLGNDSDAQSQVLEPPRVLHVSFKNFLSKSTGRLGDFIPALSNSASVPPTLTSSLDYHLVVYSLQCMKLHLRRNICGIPAQSTDSSPSSKDQGEAPRRELEKRKQKYITPGLHYACKYWIDHLVQICGTTGNFGSEETAAITSVLHSLSTFLESFQVLHWLEMCCLSETLEKVVKVDLYDLAHWVRVSAFPPFRLCSAIFDFNFFKIHPSPDSLAMIKILQAVHTSLRVFLPILLSPDNADQIYCSLLLPITSSSTFLARKAFPSIKPGVEVKGMQVRHWNWRLDRAKRTNQVAIETSSSDCLESLERTDCPESEPETEPRTSELHYSDRDPSRHENSSGSIDTSLLLSPNGKFFATVHSTCTSPASASVPYIQIFDAGSGERHSLIHLGSSTCSSEFGLVKEDAGIDIRLVDAKFLCPPSPNSISYMITSTLSRFTGILHIQVWEISEASPNVKGRSLWQEDVSTFIHGCRDEELEEKVSREGRFVPSPDGSIVAFPLDLDSDLHHSVNCESCCKRKRKAVYWVWRDRGEDHVTGDWEERQVDLLSLSQLDFALEGSQTDPRDSEQPKPSPSLLKTQSQSKNTTRFSSKANRNRGRGVDANANQSRRSDKSQVKASVIGTDVKVKIKQAQPTLRDQKGKGKEKSRLSTMAVTRTESGSVPVAQSQPMPRLKLRLLAVSSRHFLVQVTGIVVNTPVNRVYLIEIPKMTRESSYRDNGPSVQTAVPISIPIPVGNADTVTAFVGAFSPDVKTFALFSSSSEKDAAREIGVYRIEESTSGIETTMTTTGRGASINTSTRSEKKETCLTRVVRLCSFFSAMGDSRAEKLQILAMSPGGEYVAEIIDERAAGPEGEQGSLVRIWVTGITKPARRDSKGREKTLRPRIVYEKRFPGDESTKLDLMFLNNESPTSKKSSGNCVKLAHLSNPASVDINLYTLSGSSSHLEAQSITSLTISPDGKSIATGSEEGVVGVWDWDSTGMTLRYAWTSPSSRHPGPSVIECIKYSPDGKYIASVSKEWIQVILVISEPEPRARPKKEVEFESKDMQFGSRGPFLPVCWFSGDSERFLCVQKEGEGWLVLDVRETRTFKSLGTFRVQGTKVDAITERGVVVDGTTCAMEGMWLAESVELEGPQVQEGWVIDRHGKKRCWLPENVWKSYATYNDQMVVLTPRGNVLFLSL
ncbi:hypothetical protein VKT23_000320 [Stygiomarasmius scandens]|uniref:NACHT domain-containing protein n=1 Tax=Marasmiellus scandens TaxID=2682957 RepID=A0ABR1K3R0_9AGAR